MIPASVHFAISEELPQPLDINGFPAAIASKRTRGLHSKLDKNRKKSQAKNAVIVSSLFNFFIIIFLLDLLINDITFLFIHSDFLQFLSLLSGMLE